MGADPYEIYMQYVILFFTWLFTTPWALALLIIAAAVGSTPLIKKAYTKLSELGRGAVAAVAQPILVVCALLICTGYLVDGSFNPFLYFRF